MEKIPRLLGGEMRNIYKGAIFCLLFFMVALLSNFPGSAAQEKSERIEEAEGPKINTSEEVNIETEEYILGMLQDILPALNMMGEEEIDASIADAQKAGDLLWVSAMESWKNTLRDTGYLETIKEVEIKKAESGYIAHIYAAAEKRDLEISLQFDRRSLEIKALSFNPVYSMEENMRRAAMNTALGMGTVFIVLILISLLIGGFQYIYKTENLLREKKKRREGDRDRGRESLSAKEAQEEEKKKEKDPGESLDPEREHELVAVLMAAIAAYSKENTEGLIVKSIRREPRR